MAKIDQENELKELDSRLKKSKIRKASQLNEVDTLQDCAQKTKTKTLVLLNHRYRVGSCLR